MGRWRIRGCCRLRMRLFEVVERVLVLPFGVFLESLSSEAFSLKRCSGIRSLGAVRGAGENGEECLLTVFDSV